MDFRLESQAFGPKGRIPRQFTHEGEDLSPPLTWTPPPVGTRELALIVDDPDAPHLTPWVHWVLYKIEAGTRSLAAGETPQALQGENDFGIRGWGGPMPPIGHGVHRYRFRLYALDAPLVLEAGATKGCLLAAMKNHVIAQVELIGTYERAGIVAAAAAGSGSY